MLGGPACSVRSQEDPTQRLACLTGIGQLPLGGGLQEVEIHVCNAGWRKRGGPGFEHGQPFVHGGEPVFHGGLQVNDGVLHGLSDVGHRAAPLPIPP